MNQLDAEIIAIGSELLTGGRSDSNSIFLADELGKLGIAVRFKSVVGDAKQDIVTAIHTAATRAKVIIMTGGLGRRWTIARARRWLPQRGTGSVAARQRWKG